MQSRLLFTGKVFDPDPTCTTSTPGWYSPQTGRFASEDPDRDWLNWYDYAAKNPPQYTDPSGLKKKGGFWNGVKNFFKRMGNSFRNNSENDDSSSSDSSSFQSGSSSSSDSGDDSKDSKSKEPNDGIDTVRDNSKSNSPKSWE